MDIREMQRLTQISVWEVELSRRGYGALAGVDEAGRGPLAGPVVAAAVVLPRGILIEGVFDSKCLDPARREKLDGMIRSLAVDYGIGVIHNDVIDRVNILQATRLAVKHALLALKTSPDFLLIDGLEIPNLGIPQMAIVRGDSLCYSIAAASILAKVERDRLMMRYHQSFPQYGFNSHKGYGTRAHLDRIRLHGPCAIHRRTFKGVREV